ncbi:MAG: nucleotidyltransferase domain-containing protein [Anaerolineae bacterium]
MKLKIDREADALYLTLADGTVAETEEVAPGVMIDFDEHGDALGIEVISLSHRAGPADDGDLEVETVSAPPMIAEADAGYSAVLAKPLPIDQEAIAAFCKKWKVTELALFGSAARGELRPESDVDLLISFQPEVHHTFFDMYVMQEELEAMFGRKVDLLERDTIEHSRNTLRRDNILSHVEVLHAA